MVVLAFTQIKAWGEFGLSNIGDDTDFDLNGGKFIANKWLVRGGIFESKLGFGIDYNPRGSFGVSAAMYDLNHPNIDYVLIYAYIIIRTVLCK